MLNVQVDVSIDDIVYGVANQGSTVVKHAILQLDLTQEDTDFTMGVITDLVDSLRLDLDDKDVRDFLKELRKKLK